jgi:hypothetical protein
VNRPIPYWRLAVILGLAVLAYAPALTLPVISDDFVQIPLAAKYASAGWAPLLHDTAERTRATYMFLNYALDRVFGFTPAPFYAASILLHALSSVCVYAMAVWEDVTETAAFAAACFFAVFEGHNEAVMWAAAGSDLFVCSSACWRGLPGCGGCKEHRGDGMPARLWRSSWLLFRRNRSGFFQLCS